MPKLFSVQIWSAGVMTLTLLAGCSTSSPTMAPWNAGTALHNQSASAQQATMSGERDKAKDKAKKEEKREEKKEEKKEHAQPPCPQPCPPAQQHAKAEMGEKDKAKMHGDKDKMHEGKDKDKKHEGKDKEHGKKPEMGKREHGQQAGMPSGTGMSY
ncbi:hypothetical protein J7643_16660 [bacterium]|nr:hypothetical protein [bacterium]